MGLNLGTNAKISGIDGVFKARNMSFNKLKT